MAKWLEDARPDEPLTLLAARSLTTRLDAAARLLRAAAEESHLDHEHIHALRVATRRAVSALDLFQEVLPKRRRKWLRKKLRKVRRQAGAARDLDVFALKAGDWVGSVLNPEELALLKKQIARCRGDIQPRVRRLYEALCAKNYRGRARALVKRIRWRPEGGPHREPTARDAARQRCQPLIDQFAAAGRDLCSLDNLHRFRVAAKHLRYAMELFSGALNASCRDLAYQRLVQLQDQLGEINDLRAAIERLDEWLADEKNASRREVFEKTRATIKDLLDQRLTRFRSSWREHESNELLDLLTRALPCASSAEGNGRPADEPRLVAAPRAGDTTSDVR